MVMGGKVLYFERDRQRIIFKEHGYATFFGVRRGVKAVVAAGDHRRRRKHAVRPNFLELMFEIACYHVADFTKRILHLVSVGRGFGA